MSSFSAITAGFRTAVHRPSLLLREIAWRWTWGGITSLLLLFTLREYLRSLSVSTTDMLLLGSKQPLLVGRALVNIFHGSGHRLIESLLVGVVGCTLLWIILATLGRGVVGRGLLTTLNPQRVLCGFGSGVFLLQCARAIVFIAFVVACYGALLVGRLLPEDISGVVWFALTMNIFLLLSGAWWLVNWLLSLATLFAADGHGAAASIADAFELWRKRRGALIAIGFVFGLLHLVAITALGSVIGIPLSLATAVPGTAVFVMVGMVLLGYFALVDFLYLARLAAYASLLAEQPMHSEVLTQATPLARAAAS